MTDARPWHVLAAACVVLLLGATSLAVRWPGDGGPAGVPLATTAPQAMPSTVGAAASSHDPRLDAELERIRHVEPPALEDEESGTTPASEPDAQAHPEADEAADAEPEEQEAEPAPEPAPESEPRGLLPRVDPEALEAVAARTGIPQRALAAYAGASMHMGEQQPACNLDWALLAAIGYVESHHGTLGGGHIAEDGYTTIAIIGPPLDGTNGTREIRDTDGGELDGDATYDRAVGPMQFIPSTWAGWGTDASGSGEASPHHIDDAALSAARYLCASGDLSDPDTWWRAVLRYNRSEEYARHVLAYNNHYAERSHG